MAAEMQSFVLLVVIGLLKYSDVIHAALMQIGVLVHVQRIDFDADDAEVFACELDRLADIGNRRHGAALAGQQQDFL